jgi:hypothetical protein
MARITIFKIVIFIDGLHSLTIYTYDLIVLTKIKEMTRYCKLLGYIGKMLSTHVSIILTRVSVPIEDRLNMPLRGPALSCPHIPLVDQHLCAQSCPS